jgi:hypothetical protein
MSVILSAMIRTAILAVVCAALCAAADDITAGTYTGKWEGNSGAGGDFKIVLTADSTGALRPEVTFTIGTDEVKPKVTSFEITGSKIKLVYDYEIQGNKLESAVDGERKGNSLEGKYRARLLPDAGVIDEGTWRATSAP